MEQYRIKATYTHGSKKGTIKYISHDLFEEVMCGDGRRPMVDDIEKATVFSMHTAQTILRKYYDNYGFRESNVVLTII